MSTTSAGIPRVKRVRTHKAKPVETTAKRGDVRKKAKEKIEEDNQDDIINGWRSKK